VDGVPESFKKGCTWGDLSPPPSQNTPFDGITEPRLRLGPLTHLGQGEDYEKVRIPAIPAVDIAGDLLDGADIKIPTLASPLIKAPSGGLCGVRSGADGALIPAGRKWYRLKGCGQNASGFTMRARFPDSRVTKELDEIQGCEFEHTSKRDLHMQQVCVYLYVSASCVCVSGVCVSGVCA